MSQPRGRGRGGPVAAGRGGGRGGPPHRGSFHGGAPAAPLIYNAGEPARLDPSVSAPDELVLRLRGTHPGPERPSRPGYGTVGRVVALRSNFFGVECSLDTIYEYVVKVTPEPKSQKARVKRRVLALFEQLPVMHPYVNQIAHDSAQRLVAACPLPEPLRESVTFFEEGDNRPTREAAKYTVEVLFSKELSTAPLKRSVAVPLVDFSRKLTRISHIQVLDRRHGKY
jgi:eukaryotic translation initiation factor 2C